MSNVSDIGVKQSNAPANRDALEELLANSAVHEYVLVAKVDSDEGTKWVHMASKMEDVIMVIREMEALKCRMILSAVYKEMRVKGDD